VPVNVAGVWRGEAEVISASTRRRRCGRRRRPIVVDERSRCRPRSAARVIWYESSLSWTALTAAVEPTLADAGDEVGVADAHAEHALVGDRLADRGQLIALRAWCGCRGRTAAWRSRSCLPGVLAVLEAEPLIAKREGATGPDRQRGVLGQDVGGKPPIGSLKSRPDGVRSSAVMMWVAVPSSLIARLESTAKWESAVSASRRSGRSSR